MEPKGKGDFRACGGPKGVFHVWVVEQIGKSFGFSSSNDSWIHVPRYGQGALRLNVQRQGPLTCQNQDELRARRNALGFGSG